MIEEVNKRIKCAKIKINSAQQSLPNIHITMPSIHITIPQTINEDIDPIYIFTLNDALNDGVADDIKQCVNEKKYPLLAETTVKTNYVDRKVVRVIDVCCYKKYHEQVHSDLISIYSTRPLSEKILSLDVMLRITLTYE